MLGRQNNTAFRFHSFTLKDNDFAKARFNPILLDPRWKMTDKQRRELQQKADDLAKMMALSGEVSIGQGNRSRRPAKRR